MNRKPPTSITHPLFRLVRPLTPDAITRIFCEDAPESESPRLSSTALQALAAQIDQAEWAAEIYDSEWRLQWCSAELQLLLGGHDPEELGYGKHVLDAYQLPLWQRATTDVSRARVRQEIPYILADTPGGAASLRRVLGKEIYAHIKDIEPQTPPPTWMTEIDWLQGDLPPLKIWCHQQRIVDENGFHGTVRTYHPGLRASVLAYLARGNTAMFERMIHLVEPGPRKCAILFADLEGSTLLSRKLSSRAFFELLTSFSKGVDDIIVSQEGIVGYHAGDGVNAFFVADELNEIQSASAGAVNSAHEIIRLVHSLGEELNETLGTDIDLRVNIGLHWSGTLYIGQVVSGGRLEVSALGDEVNTCSRICASATGGQALSSKDLLERLSYEQAQALGFDLDKIIYHPLGEIETASAKAISDTRDLPVASIPFTDVD